MYDILLFDLDGTLTDSAPGIMNSIRYALKKLDTECDESTLRSFIGPPLLESFAKYYGFDHEKARKALELYREYFSEKGMLENSVYRGIPELLEKLKAAGKTLLVATSKPELFTLKILDHFGLSKYFDVIGGASMDETRNTKEEVIRFVLEQYGLSEDRKKRTIMIGDRHHDIDGAKAVGLDSVGVLYGYGDGPELIDAGATYIAKTPHEIGTIIIC